MTLSSASAIATKSLAVISSQISVTSRNVSSAGVAGLSLKTSLIGTSDDGLDFLGVSRAVSPALFRSLLSGNASQAGATLISQSYARISQGLNLSDSSNSRAPPALIAKLTAALQTYSASPANDTAAQTALGTAKDLVSGLHDASTLVQSERKQADASLVSDVNDVNDLLKQFAQLNHDIVSGTAAGADITDALDQRDGVLTKISEKIGVTAVNRANNDMVLYTDSGVTLFETTPRAVTVDATPNLSPGVNGAAVYVDGVPITGKDARFAVTSGSIQANAQIRDDLAPQMQTQLDEIARGLVVAFAEKDQSGSGGPPLPGLFTYPGANGVPGATAIAGLSSTIDVNATVDPSRGGVVSRLRDGGASGNPNYVYNSGGGAGYTARLIELTNAASASQTFDAAAGLGGSGSLNSFAADSIGSIAAQQKQADSSTTYYNAVVSQTTQALSNETGVNVDEQMSQLLSLENSYQASAKLLESVNSLFDALFAATKA